MKNPLLKYREANGLEVKDAAILFGFDYGQISKIESGYLRPPARLLARLAELGEDPEKFMAAWERSVAAKRKAIEDRINGEGEARA